MYLDLKVWNSFPKHSVLRKDFYNYIFMQFLNRLKFKAIIMLSLISLFQACKSPINYSEKHGPKFISNSFENQKVSPSSDTLTLVSYNIEKGEKINEAISLIQTNDVLANSDVFLLQEMDEIGTKRIADSLEMNYVYFPINSSRKSKRNFGNSILSRECIFSEEKLILPHGQIHNNRKRGASIATTYHNGKTIKLYSVHMATVVMTTQKRLDQVDSLAAHVDDFVEEGEACIIGGDFNAVTSAFRNKVVKKFSEIEFAHATTGLGHTQISPIKFIKPELDMVFGKNLQVLDKGKVTDNSASDHFPIWVKMKVGS
jgi:endonuclease/exonuclease/phosphatase family metal-dependent hydrolase